MRLHMNEYAFPFLWSRLHHYGLIHEAVANVAHKYWTVIILGDKHLVQQLFDCCCRSLLDTDHAG